jgi:hypothetical protein
MLGYGRMLLARTAAIRLSGASALAHFRHAAALQGRMTWTSCTRYGTLVRARIIERSRTTVWHLCAIWRARDIHLIAISRHVRRMRIPMSQLEIPKLRRPHLNMSLGFLACGISVGLIAIWLAFVVHGITPPQQVPPAETTVSIPSGAVATKGNNVLSNDIVLPPAPLVSKVTEVKPNRTRAPEPPFRGALMMNSKPEGAMVFINGEPVGSTPLVLKGLPVGSRAVRIEAEGYQPWSASVRVTANQQTQVMAALYPAAY